MSSIPPKLKLPPSNFRSFMLILLAFFGVSVLLSYVTEDSPASVPASQVANRIAPSAWPEVPPLLSVDVPPDKKLELNHDGVMVATTFPWYWRVQRYFRPQMSVRDPFDSFVTDFSDSFYGTQIIVTDPSDSFLCQSRVISYTQYHSILERSRGDLVNAQALLILDSWRPIDPVIVAGSLLFDEPGPPPRKAILIQMRLSGIRDVAQVFTLWTTDGVHSANLSCMQTSGFPNAKPLYNFLRGYTLKATSAR